MNNRLSEIVKIIEGIIFLTVDFLILVGKNTKHDLRSET